MKKVLLLLAASFAFGQNSKLTPEQAKDITIFSLKKDVNDRDKEIAALKTEVAALKEKLLGADQYSLLKGICEAQKIPLDKCRIDAKSSTVTKIQDAAVTAKKGEK
jgi:hypothetical protein